jgi:sensor histidine kinase regulating citrate/malate metabolism
MVDRNENLLRCIVEDNGVGINKGREKQASQVGFQKHRSRGMEITEERLKLLHELQDSRDLNFIQITDLSEIGYTNTSGTRVEVILPLLSDPIN